MSKRIYLDLQKEWQNYAAEIGLITLTYIHMKIGIEPRCKHTRDNGRSYCYMIFSNETEAAEAYDLLSMNNNGEVFGEIRLTNGYAISGRDVTIKNGSLWHDKLSNFIEGWLKTALKNDPYGPMGRGCELTRAIKSKEWTRDPAGAPEPGKRPTLSMAREHKGKRRDE